VLEEVSRAVPGLLDDSPVEASPADNGRLRRLQALTDAALAHLDLEALLGALLLRTKDLLDVDTVAVLLFDASTNELVARAAVGIEEEVEQGVRIPVGKGFAGTVAAERRPVVLEDVNHSNVLNPILREKGIKSMVGVPLLANGNVVGVLHVGTLAPRQFTNEHVELLQLAADRAAVAIEHARAFEAEQLARIRLESVQAVTDAALTQLDVDELLAVLLPRIRSILAADTCAVLLRDAERSELVARAALGIEEEVEQGVRIPIGRGFAGRVAATKEALSIDLDHYEVWNPILREKGIKSMLGVPLLVRGDSIGVLHVGSLRHREFGSDEVELLQLVAERVALAIERAQLHEEVVALDRLKLSFVAIASHELRTPTTAIYGALATFFGRDDLAEPQRELLLRTAYQQSERMRRLLDQLLDLSRLDASTIEVNPRPIVLRSAIAQIVADATPSGSEVRVQVPDDLAAVIDPDVLDRVLSNLLVNAVRHGAPPIVVEVFQSDRHLHVVVEDHGAGVPEELQGQLFERFSRTEGTQGSGLGLAIAKAYARAHSGDLVYEKRSRGARFELILLPG